MTAPDVIPLPEHLTSGECGCPRAKLGTHKTHCLPAREHAAAPHDYQVGKRRQAIIWQYPLRITIDVSVDIDLDPALFIKQHLREYDEFVLRLEDGYEAWEKPLIFLTTVLDPDVYVSPLDQGPAGRYTVNSGDIDEYPRWTPELTEALELDLAEERRILALRSNPEIDFT